MPLFSSFQNTLWLSFEKKITLEPKFSKKKIVLADSGSLFVSTSVVQFNLVQLERCGNPDTLVGTSVSAADPKGSH